MSTSTTQHRDAARNQSARCAVLTVSDTRDKTSDKGGKLIIEKLEAAGHTVVAYEIVKDEPAAIEQQMRTWLNPSAIRRSPPILDVIFTTGGTGIARRDTTIEVVERLIDKKLEGFGELFRMLSWDEITSAAMLSRATAGLAGETLIFSMPGSTNAVNLAMTKLIVPELPHLIWERRR